MKRQCSISGGLACPQCHVHVTGQPHGHSAEPTTACALLRPDLPSPWVLKLVQQHLDRLQRLALFQTSSSMAALVVQHSGELTLRPMKHVRRSSKRTAWVMGLAAGCSNVHLFVEEEAVLDLDCLQVSPVLLDTPAIWPCITKLTLCDVGLSRRTISRLMLPRLTALHTIRLMCSARGVEVHAQALNVAAVDNLRSITQQGGLQALRALQGPYDILCKLAPVVGAQTTKLVTGPIAELSGFADQWPEVHDLEIHSIRVHGLKLAKVQQQLFSHPSLKHVSLPNSILRRDCRDIAPPSWESLEVTESLGKDQEHYTLFQYARHLRLSSRLCFRSQTDCQAVVAALQGLGSTTLTLKPAAWRSCTRVQSQVDRFIPTTALSLDPGLLGCVFGKCPGLEGGLVIDSEPWTGRIELGPQLTALSQIPPGIHTLLFSFFRLGASCPWADVVASIPAHVRHLLIDKCELSKASFLALLERPAPAGLRTLTLACTSDIMSWVPWDGYELISMQARITSKWPNVQLEVDHSWELQEELERQRLADEEMYAVSDGDLVM